MQEGVLSLARFWYVAKGKGIYMNKITQFGWANINPYKILVSFLICNCVKNILVRKTSANIHTFMKILTGTYRDWQVLFVNVICHT